MEEDGHVFVSGIDQEKCQRAMTIIDTIVNDPEPGTYYTGRVTRLMDFGAFVDIGVKNDGLVHVSQMSDRFIKHPMDVVSVGDTVKVKILEVDKERQKISLTMKLK